MSTNQLNGNREYLLISDFDQTLSFRDSGVVLSEILGVSGFHERIAGLADIHLVQQGGELAYLLLHDPEYRRVRKEHLVEAGKRIRLKANIPLLLELLTDLGGNRFSFYVVSAAPEEVVKSALAGIVCGRSHLRNAVSLRSGDRRDPVNRPRSPHIRGGR